MGYGHRRGHHGQGESMSPRFLADSISNFNAQLSRPLANRNVLVPFAKASGTTAAAW